MDNNGIGFGEGLVPTDSLFLGNLINGFFWNNSDLSGNCSGSCWLIASNHDYFDSGSFAFFDGEWDARLRRVHDWNEA